MDTQVVEFLDGVCTLNGDRTGIDIGVVVRARTSSAPSTVAVHVGHLGSCEASVSVCVRLATRAGLNVLKEPLDEQGHLLP